MFRVISILAALLFAFGASPTLAEMERHLGPLASLVELGDDGTWEAADDGGWFRMTNQTDPGAVRYFWMEADQGSNAPLRIAVNIAVRTIGGSPADAGLLFNYRSGPFPCRSS